MYATEFSSPHVRMYVQVPSQDLNSVRNQLAIGKGRCHRLMSHVSSMLLDVGGARKHQVRLSCHMCICWFNFSGNITYFETTSIDVAP